jgi:hypothetical protein
MRNRFGAVALLPVTALLVSCGGDGDGAITGLSELTSVEFAVMQDGLSGAMLEALLAVIDEVAAGGAPATSRLAAQIASPLPVTGTLALDNTTPCPAGGSTRLQGSVPFSLVGDSLSYSGNVTQTWASCKATGNGLQFTFNTSQALQVTLILSRSALGAYVIHFLESGDIKWETGGKSGHCAVNIDLSYLYDPPRNDFGTYTGTVCSKQVSVDL